MEAIQTQYHPHIQSDLNQQHLGHLAQKETREAPHKVEGIAQSSALKQHYLDVPDTRENREKIRKALERYRPDAESSSLRHQIRMHSESGRLQVALVNIETGETVEEIPSSKLIEFRSELEKMAGLFVEEKA